MKSPFVFLDSMVLGSISRVSIPPAVIIASANGLYPTTSSRKSLSQFLRRLRSFAEILQTGRSAGIRVRSRQTGTISRGISPRRRLLICSLPRAAISRCRRASSFFSSRAGLRSMEKVTLCPLCKLSTASPLRVRIAGPVIPNSVNTISPNSSLFFLPLISIRALTLRRLSPAILFASSPEVSSGTSAWRTGITVCPADSERW